MTCHSSVILRDYQGEAVSELFQWYRDNPLETCSPLIVAPTGSGKSIVIAEIIRRVLEKKPDYRILVVTHTKEIVSQNAAQLQKLLPNQRIGIYSASLGQKVIRPVTFANIQSIYRKGKNLSPVNLLIIDECHKIPSKSDSMYQTLIKALREDTNCKLVGLTATPFRIDQGNIIGSGLFSDIAYDIPIRTLIERGYLSTVISKTQHGIDTSGLNVRGADFDQEQMGELFKPLVREHVENIIANGKDRKSWLVFSASVAHATEMRDEFRERGITSELVSGETLQFQRDMILERFKRGEIQALCNCQVLTTGFDAPNVDLIALCRATKSASLYMQIVGRGMRIAPGKTSCLVLDYGKNIERFGPIDCIEVSAKKGKKAEIGRMPCKTCPECNAVVAIPVRECSCGYEFPVGSCKLDVAPSRKSILSEVEHVAIDSYDIKIHAKEGKPDSLRIALQLGINRASEFLCFDHAGFAAQMARRKWALFGGKSPAPSTTEEAFNRAMRELPKLVSARIRPDGKYYRILSVETAPHDDEFLI